MNIRRDQKGRPIKPKPRYKELIDSRVPSEAGNDPDLRWAWGNCVSYAMRNPAIVTRFTAETGLADEREKPSLSARPRVLAGFLDWFNQNLWPLMKHEAGLVAGDRREARCDVVMLDDSMLKAVLMDRAARRGMSIPEYIDYLGRDVVAAPMASSVDEVDGLAELKSAIEARLNRLKNQPPAVPTTIM